ncbi:hypothetical protein LIER_38407 [Lithospermum erythrorhizon]|uniref:Uncharacterized protein n=1 Tax=Lithospermum erythrorhizon TaxID=34254 RepID=A0AAV3Q0A2_LITER
MYLSAGLLSKEKMSRIFGGKDPFNDPFFTTPTGSLFGSGQSSNIPRHVDNSKGPGRKLGLQPTQQRGNQCWEIPSFVHLRELTFRFHEYLLCFLTKEGLVEFLCFPKPQTSIFFGFT